MGRSTKIRVTGAALTLAVVALSLATVDSAHGDVAAAAPACGVLFDDFAYTSHTDSALTAHGWQVRGNSGGPGVPGATWAPENVTFPIVAGDKVMQLASSTDGTAAGTKHTEVLQGERRFFEGTYASRIRFSDAPSTGVDGDHVNQTFFTISPLRYDNDPIYSELDFSEYLPNGGWGETGPINFQTSWHTYQLEPWVSKNKSNNQRASIDGWHNVVATVADGHVKYYIDGVLVADHDRSGPFDVYPRQSMSLNYNQWFIDLAGHSGGLSTYLEQADWVYYAKNQVLTPQAAVAAAAGFRSGGVRFKDDLVGDCGSPTTTTTTTTVPPVGCGGVPAWRWETVYLEGERVSHTGHLWRARWWTQGSEPGWTAQWQDLGTC
jgi:hypothetical protein